jgi:hypothetical protein
VDNYPHLTTPELNQLIHDLSVQSRLKHDNEKGLGGYNVHQTIEALRRTQPPSYEGQATTHPSLLGQTVWNAQEGS